MSGLYVVIPAYNEDIALEKTVLDVLKNKCVSKVVIVDNNSTDKTNSIGRRLAKENERVIFHFEGRQGKGHAFKSGLELSSEADYVGIIDADDTYPAIEFDYLYSELIANNIDMIVGNRLANNAYSESNTRFGHVIGNKVLSKLIKLISSVEIEDALSGFRIFSKRYIKSFKSISDGFQLETEFSVHCGQNGFSYAEREVHYAERDETNPSKLSTFRDGFKILRFALTNTAFTFTSKIGIFSGFLSLLLGILFGLNLVFEYVNQGEVNSVALAVVVSIFISTGIQLLLTGIVESRLRRIEKNIMRR
ncbi:glycosyltransferase family 2 protein [Marinomonas foliarum]|uniref:Glycosyltransferase involved in cell wall biosynthesis n=1 Tax=Marinomonas foliarum TaxID=491950 RepID=A0A368ZUA4_9GAMM|nr:glycosyltransferase family 2 protein [Marinomonas foliarum]RCX00369.1 glycosyltransferase involved in cell wall biosynthesis [Marinomonas foliarum]